MTVTLGLIVVAAGSSARMGGTDKVWAPLGGHPVLWHSLERLGATARSIVLVVHPDKIDDARHSNWPAFAWLEVVPGGRCRQESVSRGLAIMPEVDAIAVHDAARPFASSRMLRDGLALLDVHAGAIPVEPLPDTIKRISESETVIETLDRTALRAAQTPQIFRSESLRTAHIAAQHAVRLATDDASLLESEGMSVATFPGHWSNFKITSERDLILARLMVDQPHLLEL